MTLVLVIAASDGKILRQICWYRMQSWEEKASKLLRVAILMKCVSGRPSVAMSSFDPWVLPSPLHRGFACGTFKRWRYWLLGLVENGLVTVLSSSTVSGSDGSTS